jgi:hypothetical protein
MSKPPLFAGVANASNTVDLLSDSDEDLRAVSTFARRPANDDEGQTKKKPVSQMKNMPPPFAAFVSAEGKATYSRVGVAGNNESTAVEKFKKAKENWNAQLDAANLHFEMDPTFDSLPTAILVPMVASTAG